MKALLGAALAAGLVASPAFAQSSPATWNGLPDRFQIDTGYFHLNADTKLSYNPGGQGGDVSLEHDLGLQDQANTFWVHGAWRVARRHQVKLNFTRTSRDAADVTLSRDINWGGLVYNAGLSATSASSSDILGAYYRFALVRKDRFEFGPTVGLGYLWLSAEIKATGTITAPDGVATSRALDKKGSLASATGAIGAYANGWLLPRLIAYGDFLYIKVSPGATEASVTDWRLGANYYVFRNAGLGVQYKYDRYTYDRGVISSKVGGQITYKGFQVFLSFLF